MAGLFFTLCCLFSGLEAVLQQDAAVEDQMVGAAVAGVHAEVTHTHELEAGRSMRGAAFALGVVLLRFFDERGFDLAARSEEHTSELQSP